MTIKSWFLLGISALAGTAAADIGTARAMSGPTTIQIDGGPLGQLEVSGGIDGYFYGQSGTTNRANSGNSTVGDKSTGANLQNFEITLQKKTGILGFELQVAGYNSITLGVSRPKQAAIDHYTTGPLRAAYITITPPGSNLTISIGQLGSLEGYESTFAWDNPTGLDTILYFVTNSESRGVSATYTKGPLSGTVTFGDGNDTGVFNFLQFLVTDTFNANNSLNFSGGIALGQTGPNAYGYGNTTVAGNGIYAVDSNIFSVWYSYTHGNLNLIPEIQYQYAKAFHRYASSGNDIPKETDNYGAALFADYTFGTSPYSLGAWVEYANSHGAATNWFIAPNAELAGISVAPTWQYKDLFARLNAGYAHLLNGSFTGDGTGAYGNSGHGRDQVIGTLEAGLVF